MTESSTFLLWSTPALAIGAWLLVTVIITVSSEKRPCLSLTTNVNPSATGDSPTAGAIKVGAAVVEFLRLIPAGAIHLNVTLAPSSGSEPEPCNVTSVPSVIV